MILPHPTKALASGSANNITYAEEVGMSGESSRDNNLNLTIKSKAIGHTNDVDPVISKSTMVSVDSDSLNATAAGNVALV